METEGKYYMNKETDNYSFKCRPKDVNIGRILDEADKDAVGIIIVGTRCSYVCLRTSFLESFNVTEGIGVGHENLSPNWGVMAGDFAVSYLFDTRVGFSTYDGWHGKIVCQREKDHQALAYEIACAKYHLKNNRKVKVQVLSL